LLYRFATHRDEAAFEVLVHRHGPMVWRVCRSLLRDAHAAEDAFQATFLVLVRKAGSIGRPELLGNWLYGVAHRVSLRARKTMARREARERSGVEELAEAGGDEGARQDLQPLLQEELQRLPAKYRSPMVLCYLEGRTNEEAAQQLHWPVGTLKVRLLRGRKMLRSRLVRRGLALSVAALASALTGKAGAAMPEVLVDKTIRSALAFGAGRAAGTGARSAKVVALAEGVIKSMGWARLPFVASVLVGVLVAVGLLGAGARWFLFRKPAGDPNAVGLAAVAPGAQAPAAGGEADLPPEVKRLQGTWIAVGMDAVARNKAENPLDGLSIVIRGNTFTFVIRGGVGVGINGALKVDGTATPKEFDVVDAVRGTHRGIYEFLDGDTCRMCLALPNNDRPKEFVARGPDGRMIMTLRRAPN
jgi:RNA polymerase sigma factor (sigma-70 family)